MTSPLSTVLPNPADVVTDKAAQVAGMFDRIARDYDRLNDAMTFGQHRRWKREACRQLHLQPGARVLDVCTGTGDLIGYLLPHVGEDGHVTGLDFSPRMLDVARRRFDGDGRVNLVEGDALNLPFEDNSFDAAIISFGLRNVTDIPRALSEMQRVIKPGGWMVNLDTSPKALFPGVGLYFRIVVPMLGKLLTNDPPAYAYLAKSTQHFLTPDALKRHFTEVGCQKARSQSLMFGAVALQSGQKPLQ